MPLNNLTRLEAGLSDNTWQLGAVVRSLPQPAPGPKPVYRDGVRVPHLFTDDQGRLMYLPPEPPPGTPAPVAQQPKPAPVAQYAAEPWAPPTQPAPATHCWSPTRPAQPGWYETVFTAKQGGPTLSGGRLRLYANGRWMSGSYPSEFMLTPDLADAVVGAVVSTPTSALARELRRAVKISSAQTKGPGMWWRPLPQHLLDKLESAHPLGDLLAML